MLSQLGFNKMQRRVTAEGLLDRPGFWLLGVLALLATAAPVTADEIPFFGTNEFVGIGNETCILCAGPWARKSAPCGTPLPEGTKEKNFYSAEINIFSPFGQWNCELRACGECSPFIDQLSFCLDAEPDRLPTVELFSTPDRGLNVKDFGPPPCFSAAAAGFLGDASSPGPDRDVFSFDGQAGEKITVTLDPNGASGGSGKTARLVLRDGSGRRVAGDAGALPLKLAVTLPAAGSYAVEAVEAGSDSSKRFRGNFLVTVRSGAGKARGESLLLGATDQTEP